MKKFISTPLVVVLCLALTGCGNKDEKAIQEVVNGYFAAFQAGDLSGARTFATTISRTTPPWSSLPR